MKYLISFLFIFLINCSNNITKLSLTDSNLNIDVSGIVSKSDNYNLNSVMDLKFRKKLDNFIENNLIPVGNNRLLSIIIKDSSIKDIGDDNYKANLEILFEIYENDYDLFPIYDSKFNAYDITKIDDHYSLHERNIIIDNLMIKLISSLREDIYNNLQLK